MVKLKRADVQKASLSAYERIICISDIHGELDLFKALLEKVDFCENDAVVLLGDLYSKGRQPLETLDFLSNFITKSNVYALYGNADLDMWGYVSDSHKEWLNALPDIIESENYIFVHDGITSNNLSEQISTRHKKIDAFVESPELPKFDKWVIVGHWVVANYRKQVPDYNPFYDYDKQIIAIDGGMALAPAGQLNALIIDNNIEGSSKFSNTYVDNLPSAVMEKSQDIKPGTVNVRLRDRRLPNYGINIEVLEKGEQLSKIKYGDTELIVPTSMFWQVDGVDIICDCATNHELAVKAGEEVSVVLAFEDRIYAKQQGICGWIHL